MPIKPNADETKDEYIGRCIGIEINNGYPKDQAAAICITKSEEYFKSATASTDFPPANIDFTLKSIRKVLFDEDFDADKVKQYKDLGFKVFIRSKRKIKKQDKKTWNKLKSIGLTEDSLLFGEVPNLHKQYNFDNILISDDQILDKLLAMGQSIVGKQIIKSIPVQSMFEAESVQSELKNINIKFRTVRILYTYEKRDDVSGSDIIPTSRRFCKDLISKDKAYTLEEIKSLPTDHLIDMGLEPDVFQFRGGYYTIKGTDSTTPFCRHTWKAKIVIE